MSVRRLDPRNWSADEGSSLWVFVDEYTDGLPVLITLVLLLGWNAMLTLKVTSMHTGIGNAAGSNIAWAASAAMGVLIAEHTIQAYIKARRVGRDGA